MLITRVIDHKFSDHADVPLVSFVHESLEIRECSILRMNAEGRHVADFAGSSVGEADLFSEAVLGNIKAESAVDDCIGLNYLPGQAGEAVATGATGANLASIREGQPWRAGSHHGARLEYEEVARALAVPVGTVRSRLHRARAQLRLVLEQSDAATTIEEVLTNE